MDAAQLKELCEKTRESYQETRNLNELVKTYLEVYRFNEDLKEQQRSAEWHVKSLGRTVFRESRNAFRWYPNSFIATCGENTYRFFEEGDSLNGAIKIEQVNYLNARLNDDGTAKPVEFAPVTITENFAPAEESEDVEEPAPSN